MTNLMDRLPKAITRRVSVKSQTAASLRDEVQAFQGSLAGRLGTAQTQLASLHRELDSLRARTADKEEAICYAQDVIFELQRLTADKD